MTPIYRTRGAGGIGDYNHSRVRDARLDGLAAISSREPDPATREALVKAAIKRFNEQIDLDPAAPPVDSVGRAQQR